MSKKICILAPVHDYNDIRIVRKQYHSLINSGLDGSLICATNHFNSKLIGNVHIIGKAKSRFKRFCRLPSVLLLALQSKADIYHCHNPDTIPLAIVLTLMGNKVIYDTHEDFSSRILVRDWIPSVIRKPLSKVIFYSEKLLSKICFGFIVTQHQQLLKYSSKSLLIDNSPLVTDLCFNLQPQANLINRKLIRFVYIGGISKIRGIERCLEMIAEIEKQLGIKATLELAGPVDDLYLSELKKHHCWSLVNFHGFLTQNEAINIVKKSDIGLLLIDDIADHRETSPNKLYEYCTCGKPFIANSFPYWKASFKDYPLAQFVDVDNKTELISSVFEIVDRTESSNDILLIEKFLIENSWDKEYEKLEQLYLKG